MTWVQKHVHPSMRLKERKGTQEQAIAYCTKEDSRTDGPWTFGTPFVSMRGKRSDLEQVRDAIVDGMPMRTLLYKFPRVVARYPGFVRTCISLFPPDDRESIEVTLLYGPTGQGKTTWVKKQYDKSSLFILPLNEGRQWWDGYDGQLNVLIDDFAGGLRRSNLLKILHQFAEKVPVKGGFTWWNPARIFITTNLHPRQWYQDWSEFEEHYAALERRITKVLEFTKGAQYEFTPLDDKLKKAWFDWGKEKFTTVEAADMTRHHDMSNYWDHPRLNGRSFNGRRLKRQRASRNLLSADRYPRRGLIGTEPSHPLAITVRNPCPSRPPTVREETTHETRCEPGGERPSDPEAPQTRHD